MKPLLMTLTALFCGLGLHAELVLPNIFSDHMVLQQKQANPVWGQAEPGAEVSVSIAGQQHSTQADQTGQWRLELDPMDASFEPKVLKVKSAGSESRFEDVLIGEVWMCSGQSNMAWVVASSNHADVEIASANYPAIRLLRVPTLGAAEPQDNFNGKWVRCSPETVGSFSATGYFFGRRLYQTLQVPIGLVNNAWGGSPIESWIPREALEAAGDYSKMLDGWDARFAAYSDEVFARELADFETWVAEGRPKPKRWKPDDIRIGRHRPSNIWNAMVHPTLGYGIRGVVWCQGESNLRDPIEYRGLFPLFITTLRERWGQGDFPFYWVQLADFSSEVAEPGKSNWAELREAQTMALSLPNTGEAIVTDIGEARDIHPRDKQTAANRLVRHALAKDYGYKMASDSPRFQSMEVQGNKVVITFDKIKHGLYAFDVPEVKGFSIAGADQKFVWANATIIDWKQVEVWSDQVAEPVAVRFGWANNPVVNLYDRSGLPVTPFRTDVESSANQ
ncbi:sialate O-acetylesterase [Coraliomargarita akajimensis]|uniref:Sialate O-acetylesterase n=1 Tax=Coraliomargarita akajimensis (strain DSM 45221 / IAM 15411 / JCM 23193 / KCTC 12865 / 04OKA010-24) TaxID=583355 RepID=D5EN53_CORAD|nr:sialate O-acetylesterase [Coraliomargarita akajimensis]ADE53488.1 Sialate O-acetylesterase [Coraliomargarita akajimensis DSM 45221]